MSFQRPTTFSNRKAQGSQTQISLRVASSKRCRCSSPRLVLQNSQLSVAADGWAHRRSVAKGLSAPAKKPGFMTQPRLASERLRRRNVGHCGVDWPSLLGIDTGSVTRRAVLTATAAMFFAVLQGVLLSLFHPSQMDWFRWL